MRVLKALTRGWTNAAHHTAVNEDRIRSVLPLFELGHPVIEQAAKDTGAGANAPSGNRIIRSVRASTGQAWLEIKKTGTEWRGAVAYDQEKRPWLVFATSQGHDAFYSEIERAVASNGTTPYMPTDLDYGYLELERQLLSARRWRVANVSRAIGCVATALNTGVARTALEGNPDERTGPVGELHLEIERTEAEKEISVATAHDEPAQLRVYLTFTHGKHRKHEEVLARDLRVLLRPQEDAWSIDVTADGTIMYSAYVNEARLLQLCAATIQDGRYDRVTAAPTTEFRAATHAHYTSRLTLAEATVLGHPVRAVCGFWFVPRHDHLGLPVCPKCDADLPVADSMRKLLPRTT